MAQAKEDSMLRMPTGSLALLLRVACKDIIIAHLCLPSPGLNSTVALKTCSSQAQCRHADLQPASHRKGQKRTDSYSVTQAGVQWCDYNSPQPQTPGHKRSSSQVAAPLRCCHVEVLRGVLSKKAVLSSQAPETVSTLTLSVELFHSWSVEVEARELESREAELRRRDTFYKEQLGRIERK
ncbi:MICOS complex subunit MIC25, partial [Plecturocebus cupreus]